MTNINISMREDNRHDEDGCYHCHLQHIEKKIFDLDCCENERCPKCEGWGTNGYRGEGDGDCLNCKGTGRI